MVTKEEFDEALDKKLTEIEVLKAQAGSVGCVDPGVVSKRSSWPDDTDANEAIAEATSFEGALFEIAEKYGANVTNNMPRWQDGVFLREVGDFIGDIKEAAEKHLSPAAGG